MEGLASFNIIYCRSLFVKGFINMFSSTQAVMLLPSVSFRGNTQGSASDLLPLQTLQMKQHIQKKLPFHIFVSLLVLIFSPFFLSTVELHLSPNYLLLIQIRAASHRTEEETRGESLNVKTLSQPKLNLQLQTNPLQITNSCSKRCRRLECSLHPIIRKSCAE